MDDFNLSILSGDGGAFGKTSNHQLPHTHAHKDHMLAAGNSPAISFIYDMQQNKNELSSGTFVKNNFADYASSNLAEAATAASATSAATGATAGSHLENRAVVIDNIPLNTICNMKCTGPAASSMSDGRSAKPQESVANTIQSLSSSRILKHNDRNDLHLAMEPTFTNLLSGGSCDSLFFDDEKRSSQAKVLSQTVLVPGSASQEFRRNCFATPDANHLNEVEESRITTTTMQKSVYSHENDASAVEDGGVGRSGCGERVAYAIVNHHPQHNSNLNNHLVSAASSCQQSPSLTATAKTVGDSPIRTSEPINHKIVPIDELKINCTNSSNSNSSDCESILSSEEFVELEATGYQDNTSSHSQHNASGGGGGGGGPGGGNAALLGGNGGGGTASGYASSLLPPTVGGSNSSSSGHLSGLGGSGGGSSGGTSVNGPTGQGSGHGGGGPSGHHMGEGIDFKQLFEELCPVCGDKVSGYHYGLLTCESCKGFFKRTVQNKKVYTCVAERSCHIDKTQRKRCPYCRFQKCLEVGMKLEAVRADRMRGGRNKFGPMYKRDRARKLQVMRQRQLALQALRTSIGVPDMKSTPLSPGYQQSYANMNIKQEIQIPQVSSLTQSPDSSPSPIAIALGQVNANAGVIPPSMGDGIGIGGGGGGAGCGNNGSSNNNNNSTNDSINSGGGGGNNCHDARSLSNTSESKMCFDTGTHPSSTADSIIEPLRVSPMIRDFVQSIDDREWQTQLFALLQKQTYNQVEVDLFELMCKVLDQNLFSQVDWARNTVFFKDLKVDDQMKLLQHSWSDMLVLDHLHQRIHNGLPDETQLNNGQVFNLLWLGLLGVPQLADYFNELQNKLQDLKFDMGDYVCMKFLILLNPDVRGIINKKTVLEGHENVQAALLDYTLTCYPSVTDKFRRLLNILPDIHAMASRGEEHLYSKHCAGSAPTQTLLMEMLHAKRKV